MQVKSFKARDSRTALEMVKAEFGPDAIILSTKTLSRGGAEKYEVTAALEHVPFSSGPESSQTGFVPDWGEWHREWDIIRSQIMQLMRSQMDFSCLRLRQRQPLEYLEQEGVSEGALLALLTELKKDPKASLPEPLGTLLRVKPFQRGHWSERLHAVAGPSSVGKTLSLLRMALGWQRQGPHNKILILELGPMQGGSASVLRRYAGLSGIHYRHVDNVEETQACLHDVQNFDKVFMDLPQITKTFHLKKCMQKAGLAKLDDIAVHLALAPVFSSAQLREYIKQLKSKKAGSVIWTKLDEAYAYGDMVNVAFATGLPVSALSFGKGLRGSFLPANVVTIWKLLFKKELPQKAVEDIHG